MGDDVPPNGPETSAADAVGFYASLILSVTTVVTFALAITAIPISGANCPGNCVSYPYLDTLPQYPRDFVWMYFATLLMLVYLVFVAAIQAYAPETRKLYAMIAFAFSIVAAVVLVSVYYVQGYVVPASLMNAETDGLALLIQYNPHGVFIALEELGYLVMSLSFLFLGLSFGHGDRLQSAVRWVFYCGFAAAALALVVFTAGYGLQRLDRLEVSLISVDWFVLVVNGLLLAVLFGRRRRRTQAFRHTSAFRSE